MLLKNNYYLLFKYLPATLRAKDGKIIKTVVNKSFIKISVSFVSGVFGPEEVRIMQIPIIPKTIEA